ncbi:MAG: diguanylate cyclase domain-containing protein [Bacillota bacterium]
MRMFGSHIEITERKKAYQEVEKTKELLENLSDQAPGVLYQFRMFSDRSFSFPYASKGIYNIYEVHADEVKEDGSKAFESIHPDDYQDFMQSIYDSYENLTTWESQHRVILSKKGLRWMEGSSVPEKLDDGSVIWHGNIRDITERKKREEKIKELTYRDFLTGLYNRRFFEEEMKRLDTQRQLPLAIIMADLNGLKLINDSYGHQKGDQLLQKTADIFKKSLRKEDILARQGGDEFAVLLPNTNRIEAAEILKRIRENMDKTKNDQMPVSTALGMTVKTNMDQKIDTIYKLADDAMYKDKNNN